jgi:hypothetical protein
VLIAASADGVKAECSCVPCVLYSPHLARSYISFQAFAPLYAYSHTHTPTLTPTQPLQVIDYVPFSGHTH